MKPMCDRHGASRRRGAILPLAAVMLIAFLAAAALAVDLAYIQLAETELRACLDGSARAGVQAIARGLTDDQVREEIRAVAAQNTVGGDALTLTDEDIVLGHATAGYGGAYTFAAGAQPINAVRIIGRRSRDSASGAVSSLLGGLFGQSSYDLQRVSAATLQERDIVIVADQSASMNRGDGGEPAADSGGALDGAIAMTRIDALKRAVAVFREVLDATPGQEYIGLAAYHSEAQTLAPLGADYSVFDQAIQNIQISGGTNIGLGIDEGLKILRSGRRSASQVMIVMTDGNHNQWRDPEAATRDAIAELPHLTVYTITFSEAADQLRMSQVALLGGGEHYHANGYDQLASVFDHLARTAGSVLIE